MPNTRGFKILKKRVNGKSAVYLFHVHGKKYLVSIHFYLFKILLTKRNFEFAKEHEASRFYERVASKIKPT